VSQPQDPYRRLETTRAAPPSEATELPLSAEDAGSPDPGFWGEHGGRAMPARPFGRGRAIDGRFDTRFEGRFDGLFDRVRDTLGALRTDARAGLAVLVAVAVVAGVVWYRVGAGGAATPSRAAPSRAGSSTSRTTTPTSDPAEAGSASAVPTTEGNRVVVHVAGAVARPGVVELASGSRVIDAVEAAGGGLPDADLDRLNLAAKIVDGQRVLVQRVGDPPANDGSGAATPGGAGGDAATGSSTGGPLNLNTATLDQLDVLPGIGPSLGAAIIAERDRRGGFKSVNELRDVRGIGEKRFADLRELVTV